MGRREHLLGDLVETAARERARGDADRVGDLPSDPPDDLRSPPSDPPDELRSLPDDPSSSDLLDDLASDPGEPARDEDGGEDEVWFEAEALAAASRVDLGGSTRLEADAAVLASAPAAQQLLAAIASPGISLAQLPGWPHAGPAGQGLGTALAELLGELRPGDLIVLGARGRAVGRTSLLAQLSDGLALRSPPQHAGPLTPVLCIVDCTPALWRARSLARWSGLDARVFVDSAHARRAPQVSEQLASFAAGEWAGLDRRQRFADASALTDGDRRAELLAALGRWRGELCGDAGAVWPVVVVDPIEQLLARRAGALDLVEVLAGLERLAVDEGLIVLASCDEAAAADPTLSRQLDRHARARLRMSVADDELELELCHRRLGPTGRVRLRWDRASGRIG